MRADMARSYREINTSYVYGSAARNIQKPDSRRRQKYAEERHQAVKAAVERSHRAKMNPGYVAFMLLLMTAMCVILINYITLQATLASSVKDIASLESELSTLKAANDEKFKSINSSIDLEEIRYTAVSELGMKYADKDQIVTYQNDSADYVRQIAQIGD